MRTGQFVAWHHQFILTHRSITVSPRSHKKPKLERVKNVKQQKNAVTLSRVHVTTRPSDEIEKKLKFPSMSSFCQRTCIRKQFVPAVMRTLIMGAFTSTAIVCPDEINTPLLDSVFYKWQQRTIVTIQRNTVNRHEHTKTTMGE